MPSTQCIISTRRPIFGLVCVYGVMVEFATPCGARLKTPAGHTVSAFVDAVALLPTTENALMAGLGNCALHG
jgi:hypothetical protein